MAKTKPKKSALKQARHMKADKFDYPLTSIGSTASVDVVIADELRSSADALAQAVLAGVEADYQALLATWAGLAVPRPTCIIAPLSSASDGSGGAYHYACSDPVLYCDADTYDDGSTTLALFVAELSEVFQAVQGQGWDCGASNGEGLSRAQAEVAHPFSLDGYSTASAWLDGDRPDWISQSDPTDGSAESTGCAVLFLWWLNRVKSQDWTAICAAASTTLAGTYSLLALPGDAFSAFGADCEAKWPSGSPSGVLVDNPWTGQPPPPPPPCTGAVGTAVFDRVPTVGQVYAVVPVGTQALKRRARKAP